MSAISKGNARLCEGQAPVMVLPLTDRFWYFGSVPVVVFVVAVDS